MAEVTKNPPLNSYYIALAASCFGWSETALHLAFLVPAVAAVLGTYFLAARFCAQPLLAALATLLCPVFLVSSTTVMCDTMMLAFWVWAVVLWLRSAESGSHVLAILSACLIAAAALTKYFAVVSLVPLLLAYSLLRWPRVGWRVLYLSIPVAVLLGYDLIMRSLYGHSPLFGAGSYALTIGRRGKLSVSRRRHALFYRRVPGDGNLLCAAALVSTGFGGRLLRDGADGWAAFLRKMPGRL